MAGFQVLGQNFIEKEYGTLLKTNCLGKMIVGGSLRNRDENCVLKPMAKVSEIVLGVVMDVVAVKRKKFVDWKEQINCNQFVVSELKARHLKEFFLFLKKVLEFFQALSLN